MFNLDPRSVIIYISSMSIILLMLACGFLLSGCAMSGCGNPIIHKDVDSNEYINEQNTVIVNRPDHKLRERISRAKITGKYKRNI